MNERERAVTEQPNRRYIVMMPDGTLSVAELNWYESVDAYYPTLANVAFDNDDDPETIVAGIEAWLGKRLLGQLGVKVRSDR